MKVALALVDMADAYQWLLDHDAVDERTAKSLQHHIRLVRERQSRGLWLDDEAVNLDMAFATKLTPELAMLFKLTFG